jgi:hypothetical protein
MLRREGIDAHAADRINDTPIGIDMRGDQMVMAGVLRVRVLRIITAPVTVPAAATLPAACIFCHDRFP